MKKILVFMSLVFVIGLLSKKEQKLPDKMYNEAIKKGWTRTTIYFYGNKVFKYTANPL